MSGAKQITTGVVIETGTTLSHELVTTSAGYWFGSEGADVINNIRALLSSDGLSTTESPNMG